MGQRTLALLTDASGGATSVDNQCVSHGKSLCRPGIDDTGCDGFSTNCCLPGYSRRLAFAMARGDQRAMPPSRSKAPIVVAGALVWIVVVVIGAGSDAKDSLLGVDNFDIVFTVLFVLVVVASAVFVYRLRPAVIEPRSQKNRKPGIGFLLLLALAILVLRPGLVDRLSVTFPDQAAAETEVPDLPEERSEADPTQEPVAQATDLLLIGLVALGVGAVWWFVRRTTEPEVELEFTEHDEELERDLLHAIDDVAAQLRTDEDPRRAVMNAYALLESVLARHGSPRDPAETPTEHVRRSLQRLRVASDPFVQLGGLYERARFSDVLITRAEQLQAADALDSAKRALAALESRLA